MLKLITKSLLLILLGFLTCFFTLNIVKHILNKNVSFEIAPSIKYGVFGHSHSETSLNDSIIDNFQNFSKSGESYYYTYHRIKKIIESNSKLEVVFIEFTNNQINQERDDWIWGEKYMESRFLRMEPFIDFNDQALLLKKAPFRYISTSLTSQKNAIDRIIQNNFIFSDNIKYGGYNHIKFQKADSLSGRLNKINNYITIEEHKRSEENLNYLEKILELCDSQSIKALLIRSPLHEKYQGLKNEKVFQELLNSRFYKTEFLDFKNFYLTNECYGDLEHLNYKGAEMFSLFFDDLINSQELISKRNKQLFIDSKMRERRESKSDWKEDIINKKLLKTNNIEISDIIENSNEYRVDMFLNQNVKVNSVYLNSNKREWVVLMEVSGVLSMDDFSNKSLGVHTKVAKSDYHKRPQWLKDKKSDILTFKAQPNFIEINNKTYWLFKLKRSCNIESFKYLKIFLQGKEKYEGVLGNNIRLNNIEFQKR